MNETRLEHRVPELLRAVLPQGKVTVRHSSVVRTDAGLRRPDLIAEVTVGGRTKRLLIEVKSPGYPMQLLQAFQVLQLARDTHKGYPVVVADAISARGASLAREAGVGYLDLAGNCWLNLGDIYIDKTSPQRLVRQGAATLPARVHVVRPRGELRRLFSRKATRVIRTLLEQPTNRWDVVKLATASAVSIGHAYKVAQTLLTQGFLTQEQHQVRLRDPGALLNAWAAEYRIDPAAIQSFYTPLKDPAAVMAQIAQAAAKQQFAFTLHAGASLVAPFTRFTEVHCYLQEPLSDALLQAMQLERIELGGTVHVVTPYDEGVLQHRQMIEQLPVVCNTQLYLDLVQHPTRGKEAAEFLRKERMKI